MITSEQAVDEQSQALMKFFRAAGQPERLKILGVLANGAQTVPQLADVLQLQGADVAHHIDKLEQAGLVKQQAQGFGYSDAYELEVSTLAQLQYAVEPTSIDPNEIAVVPQGDDMVVLKPKTRAELVLEAYTKGKRLKQIPTNPDDREIILQWLAESFEVGKQYSESNVNYILSRHYHKQEMLRRYLVDRRYLKRTKQIYWRPT
ncbi:MAG: DUF2087 domain-containing protein [Chloroflexota bacterium]